MIDAEDIQDWLENINDYGMGDGRYWIPGKESFEELCHLALQALRPKGGEPVAWMWRCKPYCAWPEWSVSKRRPADAGHMHAPRTEGYEDFPLYGTPPQEEQSK